MLLARKLLCASFLLVVGYSSQLQAYECSPIDERYYASDLAARIEIISIVDGMSTDLAPPERAKLTLDISSSDFPFFGGKKTFERCNPLGCWEWTGRKKDLPATVIHPWYRVEFILKHVWKTTEESGIGTLYTLSPMVIGDEYVVISDRGGDGLLQLGGVCESFEVFHSDDSDDAIRILDKAARVIH